MLIPNFPEYLSDMHHHWHEPSAHPGAGPGRIHPMNKEGGGLEFLTFHHSFMQHAFAWFDTQNFSQPLDVAPWTSISDDLKKDTVWSSFLQAQEDQIVTNNPRFAGSDALGTFIEIGIHGWIHGAVGRFYQDEVVTTFHSPQSTFFYKIHGLVDYWWMRWRILDALIRPWDEPIPAVNDMSIFHLMSKFMEAGVEPGSGRAHTFQIAELAQRVERLELQVAINEAALGGAFISSQEWPKVDTEAPKDKIPEESKRSYPRKHQTDEA